MQTDVLIHAIKERNAKDLLNIVNEKLKQENGLNMKYPLIFEDFYWLLDTLEKNTENTEKNRKVIHSFYELVLQNYIIIVPPFIERNKFSGNDEWKKQVFKFRDYRMDERLIFSVTNLPIYLSHIPVLYDMTTLTGDELLYELTYLFEDFWMKGFLNKTIMNVPKELESRMKKLKLFITALFEFMMKIGKYNERRIYEILYDLINFTKSPDGYEADKPAALKILKSLKGSSWSSLRTQVKSQSSIFKYTWDQFCSIFGSQDVEKYRKLASELNIPGASKMNKAQLCTALNNIKSKYLQDEAMNCALDDVDPWTMDSINDIPPYRRYRIGENCFDIVSLMDSIEKGQTSNPFNRQELPVADIIDKFSKIQKMLKSRDDFYERVTETPILSHKSILSQKLGQIWSQMKYPTSIDNFLNANEVELDNVVDELSNYDVLNINLQDLTKYKRSSNKHDSLADLMFRITILPLDEHTSTRLLALEIGLNNNIRNRNKRKFSESGTETEFTED